MTLKLQKVLGRCEKETATSKYSSLPELITKSKTVRPSCGFLSCVNNFDFLNLEWQLRLREVEEGTVKANVKFSLSTPRRHIGRVEVQLHSFLT
jgi:hypothetical protein